MKRLVFLVAVLCLLSFSYGQTTIDLTFTAIDGADYTQLDSLKVMNRTQGGDTVLYYPDTVLSFVVTGMNEVLEAVSGFQLFQNYPNPVKDRTSITLQVPESGAVKLSVTDILGRVVLSTNQDLKKGSHTFNFTPGNGEIYFFTARLKNENQSIKILCSPIKSGSKASLIYTGTAKETASIKSTASLQSFFFNYGDELLHIGYYDTLQSGMLDSPEESDTYIFQFAYDIPCPGTPTVEYEGQVYNTVQIMSQCWLKENLNVGTMIQGSDDMSDDEIIEKYCYDNELDSCAKYGGLYQWDEMMQYTIQQGSQGICPPGWHLPTDEEWKVLEGAVDSQYGIGNPEWDEFEWRGFDNGYNLKTSEGWDSYGNGSDKFGLSGLPGGFRISLGNFIGLNRNSSWWSSTEGENFGAWERRLGYMSSKSGRDEVEENGFSVRCIKDTYPSDNFTELSFSGIDNTSLIQLDSIKVMNRTHEGEKVLVYPDTTLTLEFDLLNYHTGDQLLLVGYHDTLQSGMLDIPEDSKTYTFQFAYDIPCPGTPTVEYEGQVYNTVQIMSQCWLKENLNVGIMIQGSEDMSDNETMEKYCYDNEPDSCLKYGGLYQWDEMMQYTTQQGVQGICPPGWHIPSDEEWKVLEGVVDSQYGIGDTIWDLNELTRGHDAGSKLKTTNGWKDNGNGLDQFGFSGSPSGSRSVGTYFSNIGAQSTWQSSNEYNVPPGFGEAYIRGLWYHEVGVHRNTYGKYPGFSVRCIKD